MQAITVQRSAARFTSATIQTNLAAATLPEAIPALETRLNGRREGRLGSPTCKPYDRFFPQHH